MHIPEQVIEDFKKRKWRHFICRTGICKQHNENEIDADYQMTKMF